MAHGPLVFVNVKRSFHKVGKCVIVRDLALYEVKYVSVYSPWIPAIKRFRPIVSYSCPIQQIDHNNQYACSLAWVSALAISLLSRSVLYVSVKVHYMGTLYSME